MEKTAIVILNYNGEGYLRQFLPSVITHSAGCRIIVADNCSTDNSVDYVSKNHPSVEIIKLPVNGGYSLGYNEALRQVETQYYVLLNSDVEVTDNWVIPIINMMDDDPNIAAAQPKILSYHQKSEFEYAGAAGGFIDTLGYPFCRGRIFNTLEKDSGQYNDTKQIFWATGACLFIRSEIFHKLEGFDPDFFAHMEEIDLCWRINSSGHKVMYNGSSTVYHVGGGTLHKSNPRKTYLNFRNGLSLIYKNYSTLELYIKMPLRITLDVIASVKFMLFDSFADGAAVIRAHLDFLKDLKRNYKKRRAVQQKKIRQVETIYRGSIVFEYFIKGKRKFEALKMCRNNQ
ncbi:glycosyltransferase family 2 protein [Fulvivirga sp. 29W222]|uniref:Glycosyltransferase family 2 protein n=1 Tax=Fulvivirga marina TaxID=2494733 RepID=A0A937KCH5_9BACT|nr:glycosyltransferase family 2 protein [Fulvivirga marina]MBL6448156.1 glycosyltransferase family 2 protein [Fulvivirga marina]